MDQIRLELIDTSGAPRTETFTGRLIVECNSGPHKGTKLYIDDAGRCIGYDAGSRRYWAFDREPDDDEIEAYCDTDEEFLSAMLKLGRKTDFSI